MTPPPPVPLEELVALCVERLDTEGEAALAALCAEHPAHAAALREAMAPLLAFGLAGHTAPEVPTLGRLGEFELVREIGRGGMGVVYEARQPSLQRTVALKVLPPSWVLDPRQVTRFQNEARAAATLDHPHLVPVYVVGSEGGTHFYAMPLIAGVSMKRVLDAMRQPSAADAATAAVLRGLAPGMAWPKRAAELARQAAKALDAAHAVGILHRDIKPGNLLVDASGHLWVADFGLACFVRDDADLTRSGELVGTIAYSSPEQVSGKLAVDARSDVYSLGATLYEMLALRPPFAGGDPAALARQVAAQEPRPLGSLNPSLPRDLVTIVEKAMAKEPASRYRDAEALAADLQAFLDGRPIRARPVTAAQRAARWCRRSPGLAAALGAALLLLVVAGAAGCTALLIARDRDRASAGLVVRARDFDQLAGVVHLQRAVEQERTLYPPWPEQLPALQRWLHEDADRVLALQPALDASRAALGRPEPAPATAGDRLAEDARRFLQDTFGELHDGLVAFRANELRSVEERAAWAARIGDLTRKHPRAPTSWEAARAAIAMADGVVASQLYKEHPIDLSPQTGLVPIGMNPATLLWEFYELRSAWDREGDPGAIPIPQHVHDGERRGHIEVSSGTGIVLVLLPGGTFTMGAQRSDRSGECYDRQAQSDEAPHRVTVAPFFLARHELTKAQWMRLSRGADPSRFRIGESCRGDPGPITARHPVEQVDWIQCEQLLRLEGLTLPTEEQWEYGCRAGTTWPWWSGTQAQSLAGAANVLDRYCLSQYPSYGRQEGDFDDGWCSPAPVGSYRPNAFGLFDMHGNVMEWCLDLDGPYPGGAQAVRPQRGVARMTRGGRYDAPASAARSAYRLGHHPTIRSPNLGLRAARILQGKR